MADKKFLNGVFIDKKVSQYGTFYKLHIPNMEQFIANLQEVELNEKGGARFVLTDQKNDTNKGSIYVDDFQPTPQNQQPLPQRTAPPAGFKPVSQAKPAAKPAGKSKGDLPF